MLRLAPSIARSALCLSALLSLACSEDAVSGAFEPSGRWVASAVQAREMYEEGALVLDARGRSTWRTGHVQDALPVAWETFSESAEPFRGRLLDDDELLSEQLQRLNISTETPVIVVGEPLGGWGKAGRIAWMLRHLGHPQAVIVDGGYDALLATGLPSDTADVPMPPESEYRVQRVAELAIELEELEQLVNEEDRAGDEVVFVDTRERREYDGDTPYGEARGGHLPGAVHLHYEDLLDDDGYLLARDTLRRLLSNLGMNANHTIVAYCTGGVRSGWLVMVLRDLGFEDTRNYAGSMWEWSALDPAQYPLE